MHDAAFRPRHRSSCLESWKFASPELPLRWAAENAISPHKRARLPASNAKLQNSLLPVVPDRDTRATPSCSSDARIEKESRVGSEKSARRAARMRPQYEPRALPRSPIGDEISLKTLWNQAPKSHFCSNPVITEDNPVVLLTNCFEPLVGHQGLDDYG